ncbi:PEP-CTERM sorting domain-containing protein [Verrucomicrobiaceae bacterium R5-34]|uniref:PEP-CTERM sorting domain-containing protein n=1 Tax=Oceaniferula flava TaxID=2800421 RepID=A0AAE2S8M0_9BACT|nr:PEP-CTERM sorting domain-containing protein [Oceaniferula flavus]MBK1829102.1 PEP-CTERM sorting domain-containing protein [Verrucomicrobiaceae bacterium R5-34]MBK1853338.1 PEP-CTERM sorting domain-containing protein [Oceaniferula flavus]MBM1134643.1 PEP-CTERM sorting domain-containing protein [Oceaniferula flavus]
MNSTHKRTFAAVALQLAGVTASYAAVLASNDFTTISDASGTSVNGHTGSMVAQSSWNIVDSSFTSDNLFTSTSNYRITNADGGTTDSISKALSPNINVGTNGANNTWTIVWSLTTGSSDLSLEDFSFDSYRTNSGRTLQSNTGVAANLFTATLDISTGGSSILGSPVSDSISTNGPTSGGSPDSSLSLTGTTLSANTTYEFSLSAAKLDGTNGYFVDVDTFTINGEAVPEPSSLTLLGLAAFGLTWRRRRS